MKRILNFRFYLSILISLFATAAPSLGQIRLSEIEVDTPSEVLERCEYVEVSGTPGASVAANTFFVSIDGDSGQFGIVTFFAPLGGSQFGSNGTITIVSDSDTCPGRTFPAGTTVVPSTSVAMGFGAETFLVLTTTQPAQIFDGQDLDANNDGTLDAAFGITPMDGIGWTVNQTFNKVYGGAPALFDGLDVPDAATRFPGNNTSFSAPAWYFGELTGGENSTTYTDPRSANFPNGGALTPGAANSPSAQPTIHSPFDFDGDGKTDIGIFRPLGASEWWINRSSDSQTFALQFGAPTDKIVPADYTGDGKSDIAVWRPSDGNWYVLRSENFSFFAFPFGTNGDIPVPGDYDADNKADAAVFRPSSATWFISQSSGAPTQIVQFGTTGDVPVVADYDGDGKADVAIFRQAAGGAEWWIQRSTAGPLALQFGANTDKAVQGDYTGDGKADIALWRPSTGNWLILRSEDFSFFGFPFGATADVPAPGDYDGDGKFDPTVFRPSSATWFIARSAAGTQIVQFGATGDRPIANSFVP